MAGKKSTKKAGVSANEFAEFKKSTEDTQNQILSILEGMQNKTVTVSVPFAPIGSTTGSTPITPGGMIPPPTLPSNTEKTKADFLSNDVLPNQYQKIFDKYFDTDDGFTARMSFPEVDDKGNENGGIQFTIFVPLKFSNTDDGYRKMYKQDLRTRALLPHNIAKGIDDWCKAVANNLKYNRSVKTK